MTDKDWKLIGYSLFVCINSKEDPAKIKIILEYIEDGRVKISTINSETKETKIEYKEI